MWERLTSNFSIGGIGGESFDIDSIGGVFGDWEVGFEGVTQLRESDQESGIYQS